MILLFLYSFSHLSVVLQTVQSVDNGLKEAFDTLLACIKVIRILFEGALYRLEEG